MNLSISSSTLSQLNPRIHSHSYISTMAIVEKTISVTAYVPLLMALYAGIHQYRLPATTLTRRSIS